MSINIYSRVTCDSCGLRKDYPIEFGDDIDDVKALAEVDGWELVGMDRNYPIELCSTCMKAKGLSE